MPNCRGLVDEDGIMVRFTYNLTGHPKGDKPIQLYRLIGGIAGEQPAWFGMSREERLPNNLAKKY